MMVLLSQGKLSKKYDMSSLKSVLSGAGEAAFLLFFLRSFDVSTDPHWT